MFHTCITGRRFKPSRISRGTTLFEPDLDLRMRVRHLELIKARQHNEVVQSFELDAEEPLRVNRLRMNHL